VTRTASSAMPSRSPTSGRCSSLARTQDDTFPTSRLNFNTTLYSFCRVGACFASALTSAIHLLTVTRLASVRLFLLYRFGTKRVFANRVYQEFIQDKEHLHMNSTRWVTLTEFVKHLGRTGIARVDETEKGWFLAWIDNSPKALAKQEASLKKERLTTSDEQRERNLISEQIERARAETGDDGEDDSPPAEEQGLKRDEGEKVVLSFGLKPATAPAESTANTPVSAPSGLKFNALKPATGNPLKRPNVFKSAAASSSASKDSADREASRKRELSAAEKVMLEDQERKRRRLEREAESAAA
jgi:DNA/RNA-binding protein KIN17